MAKGIGKQMGYQTRRAASAGPHPEFQAGPKPKPVPNKTAEVSWWTDAQNFYKLANDRDNLARMSGGKHGRLNTDII